MPLGWFFASVSCLTAVLVCESKPEDAVFPSYATTHNAATTASNFVLSSLILVALGRVTAPFSSRGVFHFHVQGLRQHQLGSVVTRSMYRQGNPVKKPL